MSPVSPHELSEGSPQNTWLKSQETTRIMVVIFLLSLNDFKIPLFGSNVC